MALCSSLEIKRDWAAQSTQSVRDGSVVVPMPRMLLVVLVRIVILIVQIDQLVFAEEAIFVRVVLEIVVVEIFIVHAGFLGLGVICREVKSELVTSLGRRRTTTARHSNCAPIREKTMEDRRWRTEDRHYTSKRSFFAAREIFLRSFTANFRLRSRIDRGVISINSSSSIYSSATSSVNTRGGSRLTLSSVAFDRMFDNFFSFVGLTSISPGREFSPTIIPSYTTSPGETKSVERSWRFPSANAMVVPASIEPSTPRPRPSRLPAHGPYSRNR